MKKIWMMALGFFISAFASPMALAALPNPSAQGRIVSMSCEDRAADIETADCKIVRVFFVSSADCRKNNFGDVIIVSGEKSGSDILAEEVQNVGLPKSMSGTITFMACQDYEMEIRTTCNRICRFAISPEECRSYQLGNNVEVSGEETDRNTGCIKNADSIKKIQFKMKKRRPALRW